MGMKINLKQFLCSSDHVQYSSGGQVREIQWHFIGRYDWEALGSNTDGVYAWMKRKAVLTNLIFAWLSYSLSRDI